MSNAKTLFPISLQSLPTFSLKDLSRSPPIAVSLISAVMLPCSLMSSSFAQSLWHFPLSSHWCLMLLMISRHLPGNISGFLPPSVFFFLLWAWNTKWCFELCLKNVQKCWQPKLQVYESGKERWERNQTPLSASSFIFLIQDFVNLVIWNYKLWVFPPTPLF